MNAIAEAPVARQSLTSQTGFTITEKAAPERMRPTMARQIDGKTVLPSPVVTAQAEIRTTAAMTFCGRLYRRGGTRCAL